MRNFKEWFGCFRQSINGYKFYVDFEKVYGKLDNIKIELNILNSLVGSKNIQNDFMNLLQRYPETMKVIPILLAKRESEIYCQDENGGITFQFDFNKHGLSEHNCFEEYTYFMQETGLFDLLSNHIINNLVDYVLGVEVGLDTHARKSRGGDLMEDLVESFLQKAGLIKGRHYFKEMKLSSIEEKWGVNLSSLSNNGKTEKRFDFVVKTAKTVYGIETNFYSTQGSKLNETARSYKMLAQEAKEIDGFAFVWFTDGIGWKSARHNLEETFDSLAHIYNITDLENGIIQKLIKQ
ncbi:MAG: restriction endonuclease [Clostridiales bacterium]|nr:restriction endonuclease [Clostridiales bacterium]